MALETQVSQTFLAHAVLAHISPEVVSLDSIIALRSQGQLRVHDAQSKSATLASLPPEVLLTVRSFLLPAVTDTLVTETTLAYVDHLLSGARRLCAECLKYNVQVFGPDALTWPSSRAGLSDDAQGCECGVLAVRAELCVGEIREMSRLDVSALRDSFEHKGGKRGHKRTNSYSAESVKWLEQYLARRAGRNMPIRNVIAQILASEFGCELAEDAARPSSSNTDVPDTTTLFASSSPLLPCSQDRLAIVARELALSPNMAAGSELLTTARDMAASVIAETVASAPCTMETKASAAATVRARPSLRTIVSAGLALGIYAFARLASS
jgi:hypothetical protein